jgi:hypothetical protein
LVRSHQVCGPNRPKTGPGSSVRGPEAVLCNPMYPRLLKRFFLGHRSFGLVRGGSLGLPGGSPRNPDRWHWGASRGPPEPPGPWSKNLKTHTFCRALTERPSLSLDANSHRPRCPATRWGPRARSASLLCRQGFALPSTPVGRALDSEQESKTGYLKAV